MARSQLCGKIGKVSVTLVLVNLESCKFSDARETKSKTDKLKYHQAPLERQVREGVEIVREQSRLQLK